MERSKRTPPDKFFVHNYISLRHKSYLTMQRYINMGRQLDEAVKVLHVPEVVREEAKAE